MIKAILLLLVSLVLASGQGSKMPPEQRKEIVDYQLTLERANRLITAMEAMTRHVASLPDFKERLRKSAQMTPAERLALVENDPKAMEILKHNKLTAREYLVGVPALRMALIAGQGLARNQYIIASPANVAFAKAHVAELKPKMDAADGIRRK
jgi:hypothetical protein